MLFEEWKNASYDKTRHDKVTIFIRYNIAGLGRSE
jgi:hypothetical protein